MSPVAFGVGSLLLVEKIEHSLVRVLNNLNITGQKMEFYQMYLWLPSFYEAKGKITIPAVIF